MFGSSRQLQDTDHIAFLGAEVEEEDREEQGGFEHEEKTLPVWNEDKAKQKCQVTDYQKTRAWTKSFESWCKLKFPNYNPGHNELKHPDNGALLTHCVWVIYAIDK